MSSSVLLIGLLQNYVSAELDCAGMQVIKNVKEFTQEEKFNLQFTLHHMKIIPSQWNSSLSAYDYFPYAHKEVAINKDLYVDGRPVHGSWLFLPWHREMLTRMGKELQRAAGQLGFSNEVQFGYWNMSDPEATKLFFRNDYMGGYGQYLGENNELNYALTEADKHPFE